MDNTFIQDIVTTVIGNTIASAISIPLFCFCYKKDNTSTRGYKNKKCLHKQQQKHYEEYLEQSEQEEWVYINCKIKELQKEATVRFESNWKSKIPKANERMKFMKDYMSLLNGNITDEQRINLLAMRPQIISLYGLLLNSNSISKKEKQNYQGWLKKLAPK